MHDRRRDAIDSSPEKNAQRREKIAKYRGIVGKVMAYRAAAVKAISELPHINVLLQVNPELYSVWNYRRSIILQELARSDSIEKWNSLLQTELAFNRSIIEQRDFKSYCVWHHRKWLLSKLGGAASVNKALDFSVLPFAPRAEAMPAAADNGEPRVLAESEDSQKAFLADVLLEELLACEALFRLDQRNFHCSGHRTWVIQRLRELPGDRFPLCDELAAGRKAVTTDISNFSAWHFRLVALCHIGEGAKVSGASERHIGEGAKVQGASERHIGEGAKVQGASERHIGEGAKVQGASERHIGEGAKVQGASERHIGEGAKVQGASERHIGEGAKVQGASERHIGEGAKVQGASERQNRLSAGAASPVSSVSSRSAAAQSAASRLASAPAEEVFKEVDDAVAAVYTDAGDTSPWLVLLWLAAEVLPLMGTVGVTALVNLRAHCRELNDQSNKWPLMCIAAINAALLRLLQVGDPERVATYANVVGDEGESLGTSQEIATELDATISKLCSIDATRSGLYRSVFVL